MHYVRRFIASHFQGANLAPFQSDGVPSVPPSLMTELMMQRVSESRSNLVAVAGYPTTAEQLQEFQSQVMRTLFQDFVVYQPLVSCSGIGFNQACIPYKTPGVPLQDSYCCEP